VGEYGRVLSVVVRIARNLPAVTGDNDVAILQSDACILAGAEIRVAGVTGVPEEGSGKGEAISLCDPARPADVSAGAVVVTLRGRFACQFVQAFDALARDSHGS
jgi:hypothetical protein